MRAGQLEPKGSSPRELGSPHLPRPSWASRPGNGPGVHPRLWDRAKFYLPLRSHGHSLRAAAGLSACQLSPKPAPHQCYSPTVPGPDGAAGTGRGARGNAGTTRSTRLLLITSLGAVFLLQASSAWTPQVLVQTKGKAGAEQGTEEAWGARAVEPPEKDSQLMWFLMAPKLLATTGEKRQGAEALAETEDTLGRVPSPRWGPEPDHDSLHHNWPEEAQGEARPWAWVLPPQQVLQGPEEDRDHIYHPKEEPWEP
ncbi:proline-rich acidic protein 1 [Globicephala melas]|uniref:proline-rich acidic protein 1 n=1 Tax=Globicephala melas TaxID=9731 RepID=UPI00293D9D6F|nr:proline-rich acidic protein 1 [Globicephala melas]